MLIKELSMNEFLAPGDFVSHPGQADWGIGQVQSVVGDKITVNFENSGKVVINGSQIALVIIPKLN